MNRAAAWADGVELLPLREKELDAVAALEASLQAFPWTRGNFADSLAAGHSLWVARRAGDLVGFSVVMSVIDEAHLLNLGVSGSCQGQGIGARLLQNAMATARRGGAKRFLLEVRPSNDKAVALYKNFGFSRIGLRRGYYPALAGREDALVYEREL